jgi:hypothetical protein
MLAAAAAVVREGRRALISNGLLQQKYDSTKAATDALRAEINRLNHFLNSLRECGVHFLIGHHFMTSLQHILAVADPILQENPRIRQTEAVNIAQIISNYEAAARDLMRNNLVVRRNGDGDAIAVWNRAVGVINALITVNQRATSMRTTIDIITRTLNTRRNTIRTGMTNLRHSIAAAVGGRVAAP